mmetsp:Transcript_40860/g.110477  ORF Transcript_40860/g.110477 Transcript_40860/m.110477 type:complete len:206 (-) Transcript_40860:32-649(-)
MAANTLFGVAAALEGAGESGSGRATPSRVLTSAARQFVTSAGSATPRPLTNLSLSTRDPALLDKADCPVPHLRPLPAKPGGVNPGSQYWEGSHDMGRFGDEDMLSETARSFWREPERVPMHRILPFSGSSHGKGTGYCPNTISICGADWTHKDHLDTFRTTYNDTHGKDFREPRATLQAFHDAGNARGSVPISARTRRRTDHLGL